MLRVVIVIIGIVVINLRIQSKYGQIRTRKTLNIDTFHAVQFTESVVENYNEVCT